MKKLFEVLLPNFSLVNTILYQNIVNFGKDNKNLDI
jgi:hypothetical protein